MNLSQEFDNLQIDLEYLKSEGIGKILAKGLAAMYQAKPKFPVDFLSKWLYNYQAQLEREQQLLEQEQYKKSEKELFQQQREEEARLRKEEEERVQQQIKDDQKYEESIRNEEYHEELIVERFPEYLERSKNLTGVYVGNLNFQRKPVSNEDEGDDQAHLNQAEAKVINYIGSSKSHQKLMLGKTLELEKGVTAEVFKEKEAEEPQDLADGEVRVEKPTYFYVPDVIKEPKMHYFRLPKLGAYLAVPLTYNTCLSEEGFDRGLEERIKFQQLREEQEKERDQKRVEFEEKLKEMQDAGENTEEFEAKWREEQEGWEELKEPDFVSTKRDFVVCADTLGQDREISEADRKYIETKVKLFAVSWEQKEKELLSNDIDRQIEYLNSLPMEWKEQVQQFVELEERAVEEKGSQFDELKEASPKEHEYELECCKLEKLKEIIGDKANQKVQEYFLSLANYRVLKFPSIFQNLLYLLGHTRENINIPGTHILDWKKTKTLLNEEFIETLLRYNHRGSKPDPVQPYAVVNKILQKLEKIDQEQVDQYNLGYGRILRFLRLTCILRKQDIEVRRAKINAKKDEREKKQEEVEKLKLDREKAVEEKKAEIPEEEQETFDWTEWDKQWDEDHPIPEIPEEIQDDIDLDCEFE